MGHPILKEVAALVADMKDTLADINGAGLAAPQVYVSKRLFIYRIPEGRIPPGSGQQPVDWTALVNPAITPLDDEKKLNWERCLSIPGLHGKVPRHTRIKCAYQTLEGEAVEIEAHGFHAMILQHEYDHLDGILYPMRMTDLSLLAFNSELGDPGYAKPWEAEDF
jgi:peptide deformylase